MKPNSVLTVLLNVDRKFKKKRARLGIAFGHRGPAQDTDIFVWVNLCFITLKLYTTNKLLFLNMVHLPMCGKSGSLLVTCANLYIQVVLLLKYLKQVSVDMNKFVHLCPKCLRVKLAHCQKYRFLRCLRTGIPPGKESQPVQKIYTL